MMPCYCQGPDYPGAALGHAGRPLDRAAGRRGLGGEELPSTDTDTDIDIYIDIDIDIAI